MAKRFTDTDKWKKPFIRSLPTPYKLLWFYMLDDCNHAGIWEVDLEVAEIRTGEKFTENLPEIFGDRVQKISDSKWFIPDFISYQYGELKDNNRVHISVLDILNKYNIKGLISPLQGVKDKDKDKDKYKDKDKEGEKVFSIEHCMTIALNDERWVKANKANELQLKTFNSFLEQTGEYEKNPLDYKKHFANLKLKNPEKFKTNGKANYKAALQAFRGES